MSPFLPLFDQRDSEVAAMLQADETLSASQLSELQKRAFRQDRTLADLLIETGVVGRAQLLESAARFLGIAMLESQVLAALENGESMLLKRLPERVALGRGVMAIRELTGQIEIVAMDPFDPDLTIEFSHLLGEPVCLRMVDPAWVNQQLRRMYSDNGGSEGDERGEGVDTVYAAPSVVDYVNSLLLAAIRDGASDIHFEPFEHRFRIRYRVDGVLRPIPTQAELVGSAVTSRLKVMADLNLSENRVPQDGRIQMQAFGRWVDVRVSALPTQFGESLVLRILDRQRVQLELDCLGIPADLLEPLRRSIHSPNGIFLATGPTGSGKTTTLYSALAELNQPGSKLLTVEDPVEFDIDGIVQVQTQAGIGLDFARVLRSFLRHDPDTLLIGEIRDGETARIAVQASLTGHRVFSSLHTNDAVGAVTRFVDLGVESYLVASSLVGVIAQRLLRRVDPDASEPHIPSDAELVALGIDRSSLEGTTLWRPKSMEQSPHSGYRGRIGVFELLLPNDPLRDAIGTGATHRKLSAIARAHGMRTLRQDAQRALLEGHTSAAELLHHLGPAAVHSEPLALYRN